MLEGVRLKVLCGVFADGYSNEACRSNLSLAHHNAAAAAAAAAHSGLGLLPHHGHSGVYGGLYSPPAAPQYVHPHPHHQPSYYDLINQHISSAVAVSPKVECPSPPADDRSPVLLGSQSPVDNNASPHIVTLSNNNNNNNGSAKSIIVNQNMERPTVVSLSA
ncbi:hypothetical protein PR048_028073 [Dryococelus australis]|uniref:Uncharacterized protein n=1 Tax=Dryococelus australis TaxID=614101 RepID=A0ABQ9GIA5_9NEOP|nr:hypothetical protein PR048_028073 [Dryococelus australis]